MTDPRPPHPPAATPAAGEAGPKQVRTWPKEIAERLAVLLHTIHGSRGLLIASLGLLLLSLVEPALPRDIDHSLLTGPLLVLLVAGLLTLAREGVATQQRARALRSDPHAVRKLTRRLLWLLPLVLLLSPRIFLAAYGIPHLNPLTGVILPGTQRLLTLLFLSLLLLLAVTYLRSSSHYAAHIRPKRPRDLARHDRTHQERDALMAMIIGLGTLWAWLLRPFWHPFSVFDWPPGISSLQQGVAEVTSVAFALTIPLMLFLNLVSHLAILRDVWQGGTWRQDRAVVALASVHAVLALTAVVLHAYDLLWIAQYRSAARF